MNLAQLQTAIQSKGYAPDTAAQQIIEINAAYRKICGQQRWDFLEKQDSSLSTTQGVSSYSYASIPDLLNFDAVRVGLPAINNFTAIDYLDTQPFRDLQHADRQMGIPQYWGQFNQLLHFWPVPDDVYSITIDYVLNPPPLVNPTDTPIMPEIYHDILVWGAIYGLAFRERDWLGRQFAQAEFTAALELMQDENSLRQRQTASHVTKSALHRSRLGGTPGW